MTMAQLARRVECLEKKIADLTEFVDSPSQNVNAWIDQIHGTFANDATYRKAARLGREWRKAGRRTTTARSRKSGGK